MCIICVSPKGAPQPDADLIRTMFTRNPHGAGYMVARDGKVEIHKGFMNLPDLLLQLRQENFTPDDVVVYHFRVSTQAGVTPEMTHPFPLTYRLTDCTLLDLRCACGVAHNGVIPLTSSPRARVYNDTARFITQYMSRLLRTPDDLKNPAILSELYRLSGSRFAIMDGSGYVATIGSFINQNNLLFSNSSFMPAFSFHTAHA